MSDAQLKSGVSSDATTASSLAQTLNAHARMETQCGEIYVQFAATFGQYPELRQMWTAMALEEGGHAAVVRAVNRGLLSGMLRAKSSIVPLEYLDSLTIQLKGYQEQAHEEISLDRALRVTWELECSEMEFMRELLVSSSNLAELGFPTEDKGKDEHVSRLRLLIQKYTTDEALQLQREVKFISSELLRSFHRARTTRKSGGMAGSSPFQADIPNQTRSSILRAPERSRRLYQRCAAGIF